MPKPDLEAVQARCKAASKGPWCQGDLWVPWLVNVYTVCIGNLSFHAESEKKSFAKDIDFMAHARQDIPALLAWIDRLQTVADAAQAALAHYGQQPCPCGARQGDPAHPHATGCPVGVALDALAKLEE